MIEQGEVRLIYKPVYWLLSQIFQMSLDQKYQFSLLLDEHIEKLDIKWKKTFTINQETCDKAMAAVQLQKGEKCSDGDNFKFWSRKHFKIERIGTKQVINTLHSSKVTKIMITLVNKFSKSKNSVNILFYPFEP